MVECPICNAKYTTVSKFKDICCLDCFEKALKETNTDIEIRDFYLEDFKAEHLIIKCESCKSKKPLIKKIDHSFHKNVFYQCSNCGLLYIYDKYRNLVKY